MTACGLKTAAAVRTHVAAAPAVVGVERRIDTDATAALKPAAHTPTTRVAANERVRAAKSGHAGRTGRTTRSAAGRHAGRAATTIDADGASATLRIRSARCSEARAISSYATLAARADIAASPAIVGIG